MKAQVHSLLFFLLILPTITLSAAQASNNSTQHTHPMRRPSETPGETATATAFVSQAPTTTALPSEQMSMAPQQARGAFALQLPVNPPSKKSEPLAVTAGILAIASGVLTLLSFVPISVPLLWFASIILRFALPPMALVFGISGKARIKKAPNRFKGMTMANLGIVMGISMLILMILSLLVVFLLVILLV